MKKEGISRSVYQGLSRSIKVCQGLSRSIKPCQGQSRSIKASKGVNFCLDLSRSVKICSKFMSVLSWNPDCIWIVCKVYPDRCFPWNTFSRALLAGDFKAGNRFASSFSSTIVTPGRSCLKVNCTNFRS